MKELLLDLARAGFRVRVQMADYAFKEQFEVKLTKHFDGQDYTKMTVIGHRDLERMDEILISMAEEVRDMIVTDAGNKAMKEKI